VIDSLIDKLASSTDKRIIETIIKGEIDEVEIEQESHLAMGSAVGSIANMK
jgi:hypothetical protein